MKKTYYRLGAAMTAGMLAVSAGDAYAAAAGGGNNFSSIGSNITGSIASLPGLVTALSYLFGVLLAVLGVMKIKDHVENPSQTPLKDGAIRLAAGGALFALPIISEAMFATIGEGTAAKTAVMNKVSFSVN